MAAPEEFLRLREFVYTNAPFKSAHASTIAETPPERVGSYCKSKDDGMSCSPITYLPGGLLGPIRTKPLQLSDGTWLSGTSVEAGCTSGTPEDAPYRSPAV